MLDQELMSRMEMQYSPNEQRIASEEIEFKPFNGCCLLTTLILSLLLSLVIIIVLPIIGLIFMLAIGIPMLIFTVVCFFGLFTLQPNEAMVLVFYGKYKGTVKQNGYHWVNPLYTKRQITLRSNNLNGNIIKVNDKTGNPIEIDAVVVWRVKNTAKAIFDVIDYHNYVYVQYESAVRNLAMSFAYDKTNDHEVSLRSGHEDVTRHLMVEMHNRLEKAGIDVEEAKITTLSYASEIAGVMLRRQQADAVIAAREKIVQGAVSIVGHALNLLRENNIVVLSQEEKSKLVSNLLVVLCSENNVHPTLNTGN